MNGVIGMTEILARTALSETQRNYVETIHNSGDTLLTLINDILDFSKIEAGKLDIQSVAIDLRGIVEQTVEELAERAQRKQLNLSVDYDPRLPTAVMGDPIRIRQILTNLLNNAIKFTQTGDVSVTVAPDPSLLGDETSSKIRLTVMDTGFGITPEGQAKLFQSFSQVDGSSTRVYGGTGLGLSICKQLSELMGGTIGVESRLGQGSTFWVVLPLLLQAEVAATVLPDPSLADLRVCGAISHPATRRVVTHYLSHWGIVTRMAETEAEFLELVMTELATDERRVIALVDETFADTTDAQLLEALASDATFESVKIVRLVSFVRRADIEQYSDTAHSHLVTKPMRYDAFRDALMTMCDTNQATPQLTNHVPTMPTLFGHVLLAEDNPVNQEIALLMLETLGCSVTVAQNGREVVDQAQIIPCDLILMDCQMPEVDGFEATRLIRDWEQRNARPAIPIVALTAHATAGDREQCLAIGMNDYISKPFSMDHLRTVLTSWLQRDPTRSPIEQPAPQSTMTLVPVPLEPTSETSLVVDRDVWKSITSLQKPGKEDTLGKILTLYLADSQQLVDTLHGGMATGDAMAVNQAAHSLKSRSAALGALSLSQLCQQIETLSRQGQLKEAETLLDQVDTAFTHACHIFHGELERRAA